MKPSGSKKKPIGAPPLKVQEPYSNHLVRLSVRPSTFCSNMIIQKAFNPETSYIDVGQ